LRFGAKPSCIGSATGSSRRRRMSAPPGAAGRVCRSRHSCQSSSDRIRLGSTSGVTGNGSKGDARRRRGRSGNIGREARLVRQARAEVLCRAADAGGCDRSFPRRSRACQQRTRPQRLKDRIMHWAMPLLSGPGRAYQGRGRPPAPVFDLGQGMNGGRRKPASGPCYGLCEWGAGGGRPRGLRLTPPAPDRAPPSTWRRPFLAIAPAQDVGCAGAPATGIDGPSADSP
jgi:hypothetical protein